MEANSDTKNTAIAVEQRAKTREGIGPGSNDELPAGATE